MHVIAIGRKYICGEELENWNIMEFPPGSLVSESKLIFSEFLRKHQEVSSPKKKKCCASENGARTDTATLL